VPDNREQVVSLTCMKQLPSQVICQLQHTPKLYCLNRPLRLQHESRRLDVTITAFGQMHATRKISYNCGILNQVLKVDGNRSHNKWYMVGVLSDFFFMESAARVAEIVCDTRRGKVCRLKRPLGQENTIWELFS